MNTETIIDKFRNMPERSGSNELASFQTEVRDAIKTLNEDETRLTADANATHETAVKRSLASRDLVAVQQNLEILNDIDRDLSRQKADAHERNTANVARMKATTLDAETTELLTSAKPEWRQAVATIERIRNDMSAQHAKVMDNRRSGGGALWKGPSDHALGSAMLAVENLRGVM